MGERRTKESISSAAVGARSVAILAPKGASRGDLAYVTGQLQRGNITWTTPMRL